MDDNTAIVITAVVAAVPGVLAAVFSYLSARQSRKNTDVLAEVQHQTNSLVDARINIEKRVGEANAEIARHEGADTERAKADEKAAAVAVTAMQAVAVAAAATPAQAAPTIEPEGE